MKYMTFVLAGSFAVISASLCMAQQQQPWEQQPQQPGQQEGQQRGQQQGERQQQQLRSVLLHHAEDDIIDATVRNLENEDLGTINGLVVNLDDSRVEYAIISMGGAFGAGGTLHAVPWNELYFRPLYEGVILDISRSELEQARGFDRETLPDFSDRQWQTEVHQRFGSQPQRQGQQQPMEDEQVYPGMQQAGRYLTTYHLLDAEVVNQQGEQVGTVSDFALSLDEGRIEHAVLAYGGWLGIGETLTALPWSVMTPEGIGTDEPRMVVSITQEQLRQAPEYNMDHWPHRDSAQWAEQQGIQQQPRQREGQGR